jgi:hypothetical protein
VTTTPHPTAPLIRRRPDGGWERLAFGSLISGRPRYEPVEFDYSAWAERQRKAQEARAKEQTDGRSTDGNRN